MGRGLGLRLGLGLGSILGIPDLPCSVELGRKRETGAFESLFLLCLFGVHQLRPRKSLWGGGCVCVRVCVCRPVGETGWVEARPLPDPWTRGPRTGLEKG